MKLKICNVGKKFNIDKNCKQQKTQGISTLSNFQHSNSDQSTIFFSIVTKE